MDGSPRPMEGRHRISALGGAGALGIWRSSVPVLSTRFLGSGGRARVRSTVEDGAGRILLDCACACRSVHVPAGPRVVPGPGRVVCGPVLCAESLPPVDRLLAERIRRIVGRGPAAASAALSSAAQPARCWPRRNSQVWRSPDFVFESHAGRSLADKSTGGRNDPLLSGRAGGALGRAGSRARTIMGSTDLAAPRPDDTGYAYGSRPRLVLSAPGNLRTGMDQRQRSAVARSPAAGEFPSH